MKNLFKIFGIIAFVAIIGFVPGIVAHAQTSDEPLFIVFPAYAVDLKEVTQEQAIQNSQALSIVAQILLDNPRYRILIDGHANRVLRTAKEETETLIPLSAKRAEEAARILVEQYKVDRRRLIINSAGGRYPSVSNDPALNRRVSFFVITPP
jgi:outer membrane protein OmpA-like peptidoglycan-associated protein